MAARTAEFLWVAIPKGLGGILMLLLNALLLRYLEPAAFGAYALCVAGILFADALIGSAFDLAVLRLAPQYRETDPVRAVAVEKAALLLKAAISLAAVAAIALFAAPLGGALLHDEMRGHLLVISAFGAFALLMLRSGLVYLQVRGEFALYGKLELLHGALKYGGIALLVITVMPHPGWILALFALAPACAVLPLARRYAREVGSARLARSGVAPELLRFVKWSFLTFACAGILARADLFLLTILADLTEVGLFSGAQVYAIIPELLGTYLAVVFSPRVMPLLRRGEFVPFYRRVQLALLIVAAASLLLALPLARWLGPLLLPPEFAASVGIVLALLPGALASFITFPLTLPFLMFLRPRLLLTVDLVTAPLLLIAYIMAIREHGAIGAAWVTSLSRVIKAGIAQVASWRLVRSQAAMALAEDEQPVA